ncbi:MAG: NAD(P)H-hydrate dehydratase [Candidatus Brocadiaceae bacterium]|nr:NAD(P)H-hydrate dehydratase [Candidatus Brocadiaceae bacterium]
MHETKDLPKILPRKPDSHKGNYGRIFVLAGSYGMTGAACLCSKAALRAGAGIVTLGIPESLHGIVASKLTCVMTYPLPETPSKTLSETGCQEILRFSQNFDVVVLGPGLSQNPETKKLVLWLLQNLDLPIVLDADGINALADNPKLLDKMKNPIILTPHPGEMQRLLGAITIKEIQSNRFKTAHMFVEEKNHVVLALKGHNTIVINRETFYLNATGNPGMATAGTGDVLSGMIASFLGQHYSPFEAAQLGVYLHGLAGDFAVSEIGENSLLATDIIDKLPQAFFFHREQSIC